MLRRRFSLIFVLLFLISIPAGVSAKSGDDPGDRDASVGFPPINARLVGTWSPVTNPDLPLEPSPIFARPERRSSAALRPASDAPDAWLFHVAVPGETLTCLARRAGLTEVDVARGSGLLNPALSLTGREVRVPISNAAAQVVTARLNDTPLTLAMRYRRSPWEVFVHNPVPVFAGQPVVLAGSGPSDCLAYPLKSIAISSAPIVRGRATVLEIETLEPATCEVRYLDQSEPCYAQDETHLYAMIGLSPLMDPGDYTVEVRLRGRRLRSSVILPLHVASGRYGYQRINPPGNLFGLMDNVLMEGELEHLAQWRTLRTGRRYWSYPFDLPLPFKVGVSAGFGDRRSYGGMVDGYHSGVDYRAWTGVPVLAPAAGVVVMTDKLEVRGNALLVDHGWGVVTGYWHLSRINVREGQRVKRGDVLGLVGNTGLSTGSHLHWEMWVNGVSVDAQQWLDPEGFEALRFPEPVLIVAEPELRIRVVAQ